MTQDERDAVNKKIAEDLGWRTEDALDRNGDEIRRLWTPEGELKKWAYLDGGKTTFRRAYSPESAIDLWANTPNFFTDPACTLMLMEKGKISIDPVGPLWAAGIRWYNGSVAMLAHSDQAKTIGEAVALAYCAMKGLK